MSTIEKQFKKIANDLALNEGLVSTIKGAARSAGNIFKQYGSGIAQNFRVSYMVPSFVKYIKSETGVNLNTNDAIYYLKIMLQDILKEIGVDANKIQNPLYNYKEKKMSNKNIGSINPNIVKESDDEFDIYINELILKFALEEGVVWDNIKNIGHGIAQGARIGSMIPSFQKFIKSAAGIQITQENAEKYLRKYMGSVIASINRHLKKSNIVNSKSVAANKINSVDRRKQVNVAEDSKVNLDGLKYIIKKIID